MLIFFFFNEKVVSGAKIKFPRNSQINFPILFHHILFMGNLGNKINVKGYDIF